MNEISWTNRGSCLSRNEGNSMDSATIHVLHVEDNPGDADLIGLALAGMSRQRFSVFHAATLAKGLDYLRTGTHCDVVLLDLSLPDATGELTVVRTREAAPSLPIVITTGFDDVEFGERMVALGAQDYLVKGDLSGPMVWRAIRHAIARMQQSLEREALLEEMRASVEVKNKMLGILAHDLRNPIGAISGYAELIELTETAPLTDRTKKSLAAIVDSTNYMNDLIGDVLALAVAETGDITLFRQRIDLDVVVRKSVSLCAIAAEKKGVRLETGSATVWVEGDPVKLEQVLTNLVSNAIKFSQSGDRVSVSAVAFDGDVRLSVTDQGEGIPPSVMARLFQPFVKGRKGTAGERSNGLGLYICSRIVDTHGGRIEVESEEGCGATFTVILPLEH